MTVSSDGRQRLRFDLETATSTRRERVVRTPIGPSMASAFSMLNSEQGLIVDACPCGACQRDAIIKRLRLKHPHPEVPREIARLIEAELRSEVRKCHDRADPAIEERMRKENPVIGLLDFVERRYTGAKLKHYIHGIHTEIEPFVMAGEGFLLGDCEHGRKFVVKCFVKREAQDTEKLQVEKGVETRPRVIMPLVVASDLNPQGNLVTCAVEGYMCQTVHNGKKKLFVISPSQTYTKIPQYTAGLTLDEQAAIIRKINSMVWKHNYGRWQMWKLDASSFDGSCWFLAPAGRRALRAQLKEVFYDHPLYPFARQVLDAQEVFQVKGHGLTATMEKVRLSGTANTGPFNQLCFQALLTVCFGVVYGRRPTTFCAGDDTILWMTEEESRSPAYKGCGGKDTIVMQRLGVAPDDSKLQALFKLAGACGVDMTLDSVHDTVEDLLFCRMRVVKRHTGGETLCKEPASALSKMTTVFDHPNPYAHMAAVCAGYEGLWGDVPVIGPMATTLKSFWLELSGGKMGVVDNYLFSEQNALAPPVTKVSSENFLHDARDSFATAFGIDPPTQIRFENFITSDAFLRPLRVAFGGGSHSS